jgi:thiol-disulfide isomerase/thioredoxin
MRLLGFIILLLGSKIMISKNIKEGIYRGVLLLDEKNNIELPFNFEFKFQNEKPVIIIHNADERITIDEISIKGDSLNFKMPVFDTEFKTKIVKNGLQGIWINHYRKEKNTISFKATYKESRRFVFENEKQNPLFEGKWEVTFSPSKTETSKALGVFHHVEQTNLVHGTFLTETGDYRFLEGMQKAQELYLSCFDGSHAFLFVAQLDSNQVLNGTFYSGSHWKEGYTAKKNDKFELRNPDGITLIKDADQKINFSFFNLDNRLVSIGDQKFENKPILIQLMGSWCPNCLDESAYLAPIYLQYKDQGFELIALAFEKTNDTALTKKQLLRLKKRFNIEYDILNTGETGKNKASEIFPMLSAISAFPTLLFLNKQHQIVKIHTGFSGPATGKPYEEFKIETEKFIHLLINQ